MNASTSCITVHNVREDVEQQYGKAPHSLRVNSFVRRKPRYIMSRDFTPEELYLVEQHNIESGIGSLWDFMANSSVILNGESHPLCTPDTLVQRQQYPLLGRLYNQYDKVYALLSQIKGGMEILDRYNKELDVFIQTGKGESHSPVIRWFRGELDPAFHYSTRNDNALFDILQDEAGKLLRADPSQNNCFWFALNEDKCVSVWLYPDDKEGDQLLMKLEQRSEDGSMGPHCAVLIDESYGSGDLSRDGIQECLEDIYWDAGLGKMPKDIANSMTDQVMSVFGLCKRPLDAQIQYANDRVDSAQQHSGGKERVPDENER